MTTRRTKSGSEVITCDVIPRTDPTIGSFLALTFPKWRGRTVTVVFTDDSPMLMATALGAYETNRNPTPFSEQILLDARLHSVHVDSSLTGTRCPEGWFVVEQHTRIVNTRKGFDRSITIRARRPIPDADISVVVDHLLAGGSVWAAKDRLADIMGGGAWCDSVRDTRALVWSVVKDRAESATKALAKARYLTNDEVIR